MKPRSEAIIRTGGAVNPEAPWLGLRPFTEELRPYFFGRGRELEDLFERVAQRGLTILFGQSGLGKTSLIQAALIPRLRHAGFHPVLLRLDYAEGAKPLQTQVLASLAPVMAEATGRSAESVMAEANSGPAPLWQLLHDPDAGLCWPGTPRIVLLLDQFEEIFTLGEATLERREKSRAFLHALADVVENRMPSALRPVLEADEELADRLDYSARPLKLLLALREDFLHLLERWRPHLPSLMDNRLELRLLTGPQALQAVIEPGRLRCRENPALPPIVDESTGAEIVRFVAGAPPEMSLAEIDAVPPLLSLICAELNAQRFAVPEGSPPEPVIRSEQLGGRAEDVLENFYSGVFAAEPSAVRALVEDRLLSAEGFRESLALDSALSELNRNGIPLAEARAALERLIDQRLLVVEEWGGVRRVELTHDVLTRGARRSRDERRSREEAERLEREKAEAEARAAAERLQLQLARRAGVAMALLAMLAGKEKGRADEQLRTVSRADRATAVGFLLSQEWRKGIAYLGRALANWPENEIAAAQLWSATLHDWPRRDVLPRISIAHSNSVTSAAFSPDGTRLLTGGDDKTARLWDAQSGRELVTLQGHSGFVTSVAFSPDGARLLTGSWDKTARLWDAQSGKELVMLQGHSRFVTSVAFSPDGVRLLAGSDDNTARLWDAQSGKGLVILQGHSNSVTSVAFSPEGTRLLTGSRDNTARLWDAQSGKGLVILQGHSNSVTSVTFSPDGTRLLTGSRDNTARLWDARNGKELVTLQGHSGRITSVAFSPDGARLFTGSDDKTARLWAARSGKELVTLQGHTGRIASVAFSPDGTCLLTSGDDNTTRLWDAQSGKELVTLQGHTGFVTSVAFSPDGARLLTGSDDKTARLWDAQSGDELITLQGHSNSVTSVAFSPEGTRLLTGSDDKTARLWDARSGKELVTLQGHTGRITSVAISPEGTRLLTGSDDNTTRLWDARSGKEMVTLQGHSRFVTSVAFSADGKQIAAAQDTGARIWTLPSSLGPAPMWLPAWIRVACGYEFNEDGALREIPATQRLEEREHLPRAEAEPGPWAPLLEYVEPKRSEPR